MLSLLLEWKTFVCGIGGECEVVKKEVGRIEDKARLFSSHTVCQMFLNIIYCTWNLHKNADSLLGICKSLKSSCCRFQME